MQASTGIRKGDVLKYALLPGIIPRVRQLFTFSFANLAYLMALVFNVARILPSYHPYLRPDNIGTYGIRQVIAQAANNLHPDWKNADQFAIFFAILSAIVIFILQFVLIIFAAIIHTAQAQASPQSGNSASMPTDYAGFFKTANPKDDIAFRLLDMVFGIPDFFGSKEQTGLAAQKALQSLFEFYSFGLLIVGFFIVIYFVIAIAAETAESGSPFGKRFNAAWAPVRLVLFFALLIPLTSGFNGGQLIALSAAKYGSGLATNGWIKFNETISGQYLGEKSALVPVPKTPEMGYLLAYMLIAKSCQFAEQRNMGPVEYTGDKIEGYIIVGPDAAGALPISTSFQDVTAKTKGGDVIIRFGHKSAHHKNWGGTVYPTCGELVIRTSDLSEPGAAKMQESYLDLVRKMWEGEYDIKKYALGFNQSRGVDTDKDPKAPTPPPDYKSTKVEEIQKKVTEEIEKAVKVQIEQGKWDPDKQMANEGWAGAGIWYNKVAQQNGALIMAVANNPQIVKMPRVMEWTRKEKIQKDRQLTAEDQYKPTHPSGEPVRFQYEEDSNIAIILYAVYKFTVQEEFGNNALSMHGKLTGNIIVDTVNLLFGTQGLYDMCKDTKIHPLAQLTALGRSLIESSIRAVTFSVFGGIVGGASKILSEHISSAGFAAAGFFLSVAGIGLIMGFILFYVVPFMPFLYFFFGVGSWVKTLFEAMVGIPLWALAHLRIDGEGVPGKQASAGYYMILEIFLRPILMIFGLMAAIVIFASLVKVLNEVFFLVIANVAGHDPAVSTNGCFKNDAAAAGSNPGNAAAVIKDPASYYRGPIDEFFFTIIYAILVYMMGISCFKLIDKIPDHVLRWMVENVSSFGAKDVDPAEGLVQRIAVGGGALGSAVTGGLENLSRAFIK